jgi:pSer/pThr/pTyr-binding forkhead associated (FHA) protein
VALVYPAAATGENGSLSDGSAEEATPDTPFVRVETGFYTGLEWPLQRSCTVIGRGRDADLVLSEATISRTHAVLGFDQGRLYVQDLSSTNGTLVNGRRSARDFLADGDELQMGKLILSVCLPGDPRRDAA